MIMSSNSTSSTDDGQQGSSLGLALGLTFFLLAVLVVVAALAYRFRGTVRQMLQPERGQRRSKEESAEPPEVSQHHYTSLSRQSAAGQNPIYENLSTAGKSGFSRPEEDQHRLPSEHEEDLYLQCDLPDDAIYSNDPACSLTIHPEFQDEDVYVVPES